MCMVFFCAPQISWVRTQNNLEPFPAPSLALNNMNNLTATEPDQLVTLRMGESGAAAVPPLTIVEVFLNTVQKHGHRSAIAQKKKINVSFPSFLFIFSHLLSPSPLPLCP
jgi:hypothetical protein